MHRTSILPWFLPLVLAAGCGGSGDSGAGGSGSSSSSSSSGGALAPTQVMTAEGPVQGAVMGASRVFLGVPYAAPPVGDLRWKPPAPHAPWTNPLDATKLGPSCAQLSALSPSFDSSSSEDCLTLNIWTPSFPKLAEKAPVMLWIHGGSFVIGSGGATDYDGQKLSETTGAVVVTINYRLGPLGFMSLGALRTEDASHPSAGMYGFEDQRAALGWTRDNIAAFGGDPGDVTIFGESAGGISTCLHLLSPASKGLFHRAIVESGACATGAAGLTSTELAAEAQGDALTKALGCDGKDAATTLACLRAKKPDEVLLAIPANPLDIVGPGAHWFPVVDGLNLPDDPNKLILTGGAAKVPTLLGSNGDEGTIFFALKNPVTDDATYLALVEAMVPGKGAQIVAHYPSKSFPSPKDAAAAALGDGGFVCPARRTARALSGAGVPTYLYHFVHASPGALLMGLGAFHSSEIPFVFGNATSLLPHSPSDDEAPLVKSMSGYWGRMAKSGDPNGDGAFVWPKYAAATDENVVLDLAVSKETGLKKADCDFWDAL